MRTFVKLSNYLADMHQLSHVTQVRSRGDEGESDSEEMPGRKEMRNECNGKMLIVSNEDTFSSSDIEDGDSSEELNDPDDSKEADPWGVLRHETVSALLTKFDELEQSF